MGLLLFLCNRWSYNINTSFTYGLGAKTKQTYESFYETANSHAYGLSYHLSRNDLFKEC